MLTRVFKSGNSLAVRIPWELGFDEAGREVEIERQGDTIIIRPVQKRSLAGLMDKFAAFPSDLMIEGRGCHEEKERQG